MSTSHPPLNKTLPLRQRYAETHGGKEMTTPATSTPPEKITSSDSSTSLSRTKQTRSRSRSKSPTRLSLPIRTRSPIPSRHHPASSNSIALSEHTSKTQLDDQTPKTTTTHPSLLIPNTREWHKTEQGGRNTTNHQVPQHIDGQTSSINSQIATLSIRTRRRGKYEMTQEELDAVAKEWADAFGWNGQEYTSEAPYLTLDQWLDLVEEDRNNGGQGEKGPDALLEEYYRNKATGMTKQQGRPSSELQPRRFSVVFRPKVDQNPQVKGATGDGKLSPDASLPITTCPSLHPNMDVKHRARDETKPVIRASQTTGLHLFIADVEAPLDELCQSLGCLVDHPHPIGRYLARGHVPRTYNDVWGLSDPPHMVWEAWARMNRGAPGEWDETVLQGFARAHFWDGPEAANEAGERLLGRRVQKVKD